MHEHFGHWGQAAEQFLDSLAKCSRDMEGNPNAAELKKKQPLEKAPIRHNTKCNANVILKKISRPCKGTKIQDNQFDRDINSFIH